MQLQEILSSLTSTPSHIIILEYLALAAMVILFLLALSSNSKHSTRSSIVFMILCSISLTIGIGTLAYESNSHRAAINDAKITRSGDKIRIESDSEFLKSTDLDVVSEKDGYIYVEFKNKTYRLEDLSKKGN